MKLSKILKYSIPGLFIILLLSINIFAQSSFNDLSIELHKNFDINNYDLFLTAELNNNGPGFSEVYIKTTINNEQILTIGKKYIKQGPGYFSQLMLSDQNTSLPLIQREGSFFLENKKILFSQMLAYLDENVNKQLFVHRLEVNTLYPGLSLGVSEAMMASNVVHPAYYLPFPFWPYYLTAKLIGIYSEYNSHEDKYIGFDFSYEFKNKSKIYAELLVDEYPMKSEYGNPDERAHLIGYYYPYNNNTALRFEYSNVFNYVYIHRYPENIYTYNGELLGHYLGPDADVLNLEYKKTLDKNKSYSLNLRHTRKGIGNLNEDYDSDHEEKKFLSEISSSTTELIISYNDIINKNIKYEVNLNIGQGWSFLFDIDL